MEQASPSPEACAALLRALPGVNALRKALRAITPAEALVWLPVLSVVSRYPDGLRMGALAEELKVDQSVASRQFARIETAGLGARTTDPSDGRAQLLRATPAGQAWIADAVDAYSVPLAALLPGWSDDDVRALTVMLGRLADTVAAAPATMQVLDLHSPVPQPQQEPDA